MNDRRKIAIRAAIAALLFSGMIYLLLGVSSSPLPRFLAGGDLWIENNRMAQTEKALIESDALSKWKKTAGGEKFFAVYSPEREKIKSALGGALDWIGFGPWRVAVTLGDDNSPVIIVGAGNLAFLGKSFFKSSGFVAGVSIEDHDVLQKGDLIFARVKGFWIIGKRDGVAKAMRAYDDDSGLAAWKTTSWPAKGRKGAIVAISPEYLRALITPADPSPNFDAEMKEWTDWDEWSGVVATFDASKDKIAGDAWLRVDRNLPVSKIFSELGSGDSSSDWLNFQTAFAFKATVKDPEKLWEQARALYANRPLPIEIINSVETQLKNELKLDLPALLNELEGGMGFSTIIQDDKPHTVLFSGVSGGAQQEFERLESGVEGKWQPGFESMNIRYMPRLLAYTVKDNKIIMAKTPQVLVNIIKNPDSSGMVPKIVMAAIESVASKPLVVVGRWPKAINSQGIKDNNWYAAGMEYSGDNLTARFIMQMQPAKPASVPFKIRLLNWTATLATIVGWIIAAISLVIFFVNILSLRPKKTF